ncbi:MAG TPA: gliding motility-associated C-terminal domain-containing protein [Cyclobacteriaceae bacterium]|jgi:gliding motility-associated-like protein|nr:gliding motility-associated C-terminal domain-containing protein [Cyclobacteriaceae bacterium]
MRRVTFLKFFLILVFGSSGFIKLMGQNLVPNPDFECGVDECAFSDDPNMTAKYFCQWWAPSLGCPDMFTTSLGSNCFSGQPESGLVDEQPGTQMPHSGKRFAGIFTYGNTTAGAYDNYREYISTTLLQPLVVGKYYRASMYVACSNRMVYAANNLGICFTVGGILNRATNQVLTSYQPQVVSNDVITATQWVRICGVFMATSPANVIMIGNFSGNSVTSAINRTGGAADSHYYNAFYFIDDVAVEQVDGPDGNSVSVSGSDRVCKGDSTSLSVSQNFDLIKWSTWPDTSNIISTRSVLRTMLQKTTTILVSGKTCGTYAHDTLTITVDPIPKITLGRDTTLCQGSQLTLDPGRNYSTYLWQDQSVGQTDVANSPGHYRVTVTNSFGCSGNAAINVSFLSPPSVDLGKDVFACTTFPKFSATNQGSTYSWSSGSVDSIYYPVSAGRYWVTVKNQCGVASDTVTIKTPEGIFYNNVVTLNGDGKNETFKVTGLTDDTLGNVKIFNRWGDVIFSGFPYRNNWPLSAGLPADTYYFFVAIPGCPQTYKGWVEVLK